MKPLTTSLAMKVLLVDDHPLILDALQTVIAGSGSPVKVVGATNANEARSILAQVMRGQIYVPAMLLGSQPEPPVGALHTTSSSSASARPGPPRRTLESYGLTPRQTDVLALLLQGKPNKLIARDLHVSVETVKDHVAAVLRALDVSTRTQAVLVVSEMAPSSLGVLRKNAA